MERPQVAAVNAAGLSVDEHEFQRSFGKRPFLVRHELSEDPLFEIERLLQLARDLPEDRVEYNSGELGVHTEPDRTPHTGLTAEETIRQIGECKSWLVLKNVEHDPAYRELLYRCLDQVQAMGHPDARRIIQREGFIFVSSPGATTPYHIDPEWNFLLQVRGSKHINVFPSDDREILTDESLERFYSGAHRNLPFRDEFQSKAQAFELQPGDGVHVPVTAPHWVRNGPAVSVSFSITFQTLASARRGMSYRVNDFMRQSGLHPVAVGQSGWRDELKYQSYRAFRRLRSPKRSGS
jgi:hypothetical protein